ncbi:hypothetical protein EB001_17465 [bacterium]|nr:hypothetical protein [bacterium]
MLSFKVLNSLRSLHIEAIDWHNRVVSNGGSVSPTTLKAVSDFCKSVDGAGIRSKFLRLNLFCGNNLNACTVPLYRGYSYGGTLYGSSTEANTNFVSSDYTETGSNKGLNGTTGSKYLDTGLTIGSAYTAGIRYASNHMGIYITDTNLSTAEWMGANDTNFGCYDSNAFAWYSLNTGAYIGGADSGDHAIATVAGTNNGFALGTYTSISAGATYRNGIDVTNTVGGLNFEFTAGNTLPLIVCATSYSYVGCGTTIINPANTIVAGYSIGLGLTLSQSLSYNNAMQTFQTVLGRKIT